MQATTDTHVRTYALTSAGISANALPYIDDVVEISWR
jgi:hypothetical protein